MQTTDTFLPTQDERIMAGLAHIACLLPMMGAIAPIVIWVTQKEKSKFVAFQALQALAYQLSMVVAWILGMACYMLSFFSIFFGEIFTTSLRQADSQNPLAMIFFMAPFLVFGSLLLGMFVFVIYGIVGAVLAFQGKPFRYLLIGRLLEKFLEPKGAEAVPEHVV
jgi:uncharacterized Tic20 family protein